MLLALELESLRLGYFFLPFSSQITPLTAHGSGSKKSFNLHQVLNRLTYASTLSHLRRLNSPIGREGKGPRSFPPLLCRLTLSVAMVQFIYSHPCKLDWLVALVFQLNANRV